MSFWEPSHKEPANVSPVESFRLEDALQTLTGKQRFVVELRFGLKDGEFYTFEEIAEAMGVSIPTVWEHELAALKKLRKAP